MGHPSCDAKSRVNVFAHVNYARELERLGVLLCINGTGILNAWMHRNIVATDMGYAEMNEFDVAEFLTEVDTQRMPMVFRLLSKGKAAEVFANLEAPEQELIINSITDSELGAIIEDLYVDDAVDMMEELPANVVKPSSAHLLISLELALVSRADANILF